MSDVAFLPDPHGLPVLPASPYRLRAFEDRDLQMLSRLAGD